MADVEADKPKKAKRTKKSTKPKEEEQPLTDEPGSSTQGKLDALLKQAVTQAKGEVSMKKKKKKKDDGVDPVLESLRKGEGIQKDEDAAILANTYNPDESPKSKKSNKQREKLNESGKDNLAMEKDNFQIIDELQDKPAKKKKKKPKTETDKNVEDREMSISDLAPKDKTMTISELDASVAGEKSKKKKKSAPEPVENDVVDGGMGAKKGRKKLKEADEEALSPEREERVMSPAAGKGKKKKPKTPEVSPRQEEEEEVISPKGKKKKPRMPEQEEEEIPFKEEELTSPKGKKKKAKTPDEEDVLISPKGKKKKVKKTDDEISPREEEDVPAPEKGGGKKGKKKAADDEAQSPRSEGTTSPTETKKKKKKVTMADDVSPRPEEEEEVVSPRGGKKKKKKGKTEEEEEEQADEKEDKKDEETEPTTEDGTPQKKPRKKKKKEDTEPVPEGDHGDEAPKMEVEDEGEILSIIIHRTDKLKNDFHIRHPLVRVHIMDENTGRYLPKQTKDRAVTAFFEVSNEKVDYVLPIMTQPFDFKENKSTLPYWEERLIFNENYNYFIQTEPKVIIFFELLDFVSMNTASRQVAQIGKEGGWHRIAWAFLKIVGNNNKVNVDNKVRLQLFEPPTKTLVGQGQAEIYQWWKAPNRKTYPSTLYVTLKGITPPKTVEPSQRSMFAVQEEVGKMTYQDLKKSMHWSSKLKPDTQRAMSSWGRLTGQLCRIPNSLVLSLPAGRKGCFTLKFSHNGRNLACACQDRDGYPVLVYEIPSGTLKGRFIGHINIVYDLCWAKHDTHLLTASGDGTARVWNIENFGDAEKILPHPGFVYTAAFHPRIDSLVVTGGYDQVIRVWDTQSDEQYIRTWDATQTDRTHGELKQEIEDHQGYITSLCFDDDGQKLYSADSVGSIKVWNVFVTEQPTQVGFLREWTLYQRIDDPEVKDTVINFIKMHPSGRRLLVHCRDNIVRMLDLRVQRIMQRYIGGLNFREQIRSTVTPCGSFVFAGSEDNFAYAWSTETGDQVAMYSELNYQNPVTDVDYHPRDHMVAFCALGEMQSILIYNYDPYIAQRDAGLSPRQITPETKAESDAEELGTTQAENLATATGVMTKDEFQANSASRLEKVMRKLNSATSMMASTPMMTMDLPGMTATSPRPTMHTGLGSWGSSFDQSYMTTPRSMMATPQAFSPHAPRTMTSTMQHQQFASQNLYLKDTESGWRPGFSELGRRGARSTSPTFIGRPQISLNASQGKAQFNFQAPTGKVVSQYEQVVALYDYRGQRSDELTIFRGDVITVMYKDNENWWMGELADGRQGYFPANYVAEEGSVGMDDDQRLELRNQDDSPDEDNRRKMTAVRTKNGELKFISGTEDSEEELEPRKNRRRKKRPSNENGLNDSPSEEPSTSSRGQRRVRIQESAA